MNQTPDIFDYSLQEQLRQDAPLADRLRPRNLEQFIGQSHILAPGRLLRRAIQADQLSSLIFYGPPGTGKTTLARIIANTTKAQFISLNAVLSGVKEIRAGIASAEKFRKEYTRKTILFVDEVHRFNKAQQDALLPHVENGTVILIGATTENPYFEVNKALVSRSRIFQLKSLEAEDLERVLDFALSDRERGYGNKIIELDLDARKHLIQVANGDARALLNALELAVETSEPDSAGLIRIDLTVAEESIQKKAVLYDKDGDAHFDTISAFIKSLRGSDPDAALYWMAKMVYGGEDPRFIFRRMIIFAAEDVGMADPRALQVVMSAAQAFDYVGMPEGRFHLAEACLYLVTAPKSNSGFAFFDALEAVEKNVAGEVPDPIKDGNRDREGFGHGKGYLYPHAYKDHWVAQQYLPDLLQGRVFYQPSDQGFEAEIKQGVIRRRETQLASLIESAAQQKDDRLHYWQGRTLDSTAELLAEIRDFTFSQIDFTPQQLVLVLNAGEGVFLGEAIRKLKEGTIYGAVETGLQKSVLEKRFAGQDYLFRPLLFVSDPDAADFLAVTELDKTIGFDRILGRNVLSKRSSNLARLQAITQKLNKTGLLLLTESIPAEAQRLSSFLNPQQISADLLHRVLQAEDQPYRLDNQSGSVWNEQVLRQELEKAGLSLVSIQKSDFFNKTMVTRKKLTEWFTSGYPSGRTYADYLMSGLTKAEVEQVRGVLEHELSGRVVSWKSSWLFVKASLRL